LRQHARILIVTEVRGAETAVLLREASARWATYCTFHGDSPQAAVSRMLTLARSDSWSLRSPYGSAGDADVYRDVARAFPFVVQTDVERRGERARYVVRGIYRLLMAPGEQEPRFEPLFWHESGEWKRAGQIPALPQRVPPQRIQPASVLAREGLERYRRGERQKAREFLEQAVRQTRRPGQLWLQALRDLADGNAAKLRQDAQQVIAALLREEGQDAAQTLDDVRRGSPTVYAFVDLARTGRDRDSR
jgi:vacuolar-type H+-ATPase subunit H